jgi:hypothetical protein
VARQRALSRSRCTGPKDPPAARRPVRGPCAPGHPRASRGLATSPRREHGGPARFWRRVSNLIIVLPRAAAWPPRPGRGQLAVAGSNSRPLAISRTSSAR